MYAGQRHSCHNGDGERSGFFVGDGTGVGKGREIASLVSIVITTYYLLPTTYYLPLTTYYLVLATYYLLLTTYYLRLTTYYLLLTNYY